jgi:hypothetical protein
MMQAPAADDIRKLDRGTLDSPNLPSNDEGQSPRDPPEPDAASSSSDFPESPGSGSNDVACRWTNAVDSAAAMTLSSPDETQLWSSNVVTRQLPPTDDSGSSSSGGVDIRLTSKSLAEEAPTSLEYFTASEHLDSSDEDEDKLMQRLTSLDAISLLSNLESSSSPSLEMKVSDAQMSNNDGKYSNMRKT